MPRLIFLAATLGCLAPALSAEQTGPVSQTGTASSASASDYELRGFFGAGDELEVSVRNTATGKSEWLRVGEKTEGLLVEKADSAAGTATLRAGDRHYRLRLAAEAPPDPLNAEEAKKLSPDEEARAQRKARIEAMRKNMTPEQMEAFGKIMLTKNTGTRKALPGAFQRTTSRHHRSAAEDKCAERFGPSRGCRGLGAIARQGREDHPASGGF